MFKVTSIFLSPHLYLFQLTYTPSSPLILTFTPTTPECEMRCKGELVRHMRIVWLSRAVCVEVVWVKLRMEENRLVKRIMGFDVVSFIPKPAKIFWLWRLPDGQAETRQQVQDATAACPVHGWGHSHPWVSACQEDFHHPQQADLRILSHSHRANCDDPTTTSW